MRRALLVLGLLALASASLALPAPAPDRREVYSELLRADALAFRKAEKEAPIIDELPMKEGEFRERFVIHYGTFGVERSQLRIAIAKKHHLKIRDLVAIDEEGDREHWVRP